MIAETMRPDLYLQYVTRIKSDQTRDAFFYIVGRTACLKTLVCYPKDHGLVPAYRFYKSPTAQPFAFIPNANWLLFYVRTPAVRSKRYSFPKLQSAFKSAQENSTGEWTVKLRNIEDVRALFNFLQLEE